MSEIYEIKKSTLVGIANAVRTKTGGTEGILTEDLEPQILGITTKEDLSEELDIQDDLIDNLRGILNEKGCLDITPELTEQDQLISQISEVLDSKSAATLPTLSNPASADHILSGYEALDGSGQVIQGTHVSDGDYELVINSKASTSHTYTVPAGTTKVFVTAIVYRNGVEYNHMYRVYELDFVTKTKNEFLTNDPSSWFSGTSVTSDYETTITYQHTYGDNVVFIFTPIF